MFITKPSKLGLTLVLYFALAVALVATVEAKGFAAVPLHRRDHVDINRMIKKRAGPLSNLAADLFPASNGAAADPPSDSNTNTGGNTANTGGDSNGNGGNAGGNPSNSASASASNNTPSKSASASPSSSVAPTSQSQSSSAAAASPTSSAASSSASSSSTSQSASANLLNSLVSNLLPSSSSSSTQAATTSAPQTSASLNLQPVPSASPDNQGPSVQSITVTSSIPSPSQTAASDKADTPQSSSKLPHTALIIIIVVASCVGGIAIIWTGIRKWKFRPSKDFEDRMQPIDWQPTDHDSGLPTHRRVPSNASSFHSSGHDSTGAKGVGGYGATSESALNPIPDHDFTAGASLAPVGGYADLARGPSPGPYARDPSPGPYGGPSAGPYRGPSPGPQMQEALTRGPSVTRADPYAVGVPLHHQGGGGYPLQNPYEQTGY